MMLVELNKWEFADRIRAFDSCSLPIAACDALYAWLEQMIDEKILDPNVCVGDWAIQTCEYELVELQSEHEGRELSDWDAVREAVSYDFLDNCYSDVIVVDDQTAVLVSL